MKAYIPYLNDEVLLDNDSTFLYLPSYKLIKLMEIIYPLDKIYKIEKIISYNDEDYLLQINDILGHDIELFNHKISKGCGYFHITFEKIITKNLPLHYDTFCPYAISIIIKNDKNEYLKYEKVFKQKIFDKK